MGNPNSRSMAFRYPEDDKAMFGFTDGPGQQLFVLVTSAAPLQSNTQWLSDFATQNMWNPEEASGIWTWWDGQLHYPTWERHGVMSDVRGSVSSLPNVAAMEELMTAIQDHFPTAKISSLTFPVLPQSE